MEGVFFCSLFKFTGHELDIRVFCMTGPVDESKNQLPDILCVIQVWCIFGIRLNNSHGTGL